MSLSAYSRAHDAMLRESKKLGWKFKGLTELDDGSHTAKAVHSDGRLVIGAGREEDDALNDMQAKIGGVVRLPTFA